MVIFYPVIFIFGLAMGSFLNSVIFRLRIEESVVTNAKGNQGLSRSYCPHCKNTLHWQDLIPILSFLILRGKCRYCQGKISLQYPFVELSTAFLFSFIFYFVLQSSSISTPYQNLWFGTGQAFQQSIYFFYLLFASSALIIIFVYDLKHYIIPDKVIYPAIGAALLYRIFEVLGFSGWDLIGHLSLGFGILRPMVNPLSAAFVAGAFFLLIVIISQGKWMGLGDPKLAFFMGLFLGFPKILVALFLAFFIGAIIGIGLIIFSERKLKSEVPFGPFLVMGTLVALFWGHNLINWYFRLFFTL